MSLCPPYDRRPWLIVMPTTYNGRHYCPVRASATDQVCRTAIEHVAGPDATAVALQMQERTMRERRSCLAHYLRVKAYWLSVNAVDVRHGGLVASALGTRTRRPRFESRVAPLFHWVATLGKLFTHIASPVSQLQETGVEKGVFGA